MTAAEFAERLVERLHEVGPAAVPMAAMERLEAYFRLLERWNARINLTSLPLKVPNDETFDRLLVEPIAAAAAVADSSQIWFDLGSGGGSPAIPLKILRPKSKLVMVESKARKAAFLREAVRALELADVHVENGRFEEVAQNAVGAAHLVTARAVRGDQAMFGAVGALLRIKGRFLWFHSNQPVNVPDGYNLVQRIQISAGNAHLSVLEKLFHVEQSQQTG